MGEKEAKKNQNVMNTNTEIIYCGLWKWNEACIQSYTLLVKNENRSRFIGKKNKYKIEERSEINKNVEHNK